MVGLNVTVSKCWFVVETHKACHHKRLAVLGQICTHTLLRVVTLGQLVYSRWCSNIHVGNGCYNAPGWVGLVLGVVYQAMNCAKQGQFNCHLTGAVSVGDGMVRDSQC